MRFRNRQHAGMLLARALEIFAGDDPVVYALPRGGVEIGTEIAGHLHAPLDLIVSRKVGHPLSSEYAVCAVTGSGEPICNMAEVGSVDEQWLEIEIQRQIGESRRRRELYLEDRPPLAAEGKLAIVVDDGVATGLTMLAAIREIKNRLPDKIMVAVPVIPRDTAVQLTRYADEVVAVQVPEDFAGYISAYYDEFEQVSDKEVVQLLERFDAEATAYGKSR